MSVSTRGNRSLSGYSHPCCYLREVGDCSEKASREHLMTRSILELVDAPSTGWRWLKGEEKHLPPDALAARVLCKSHNERLAPLDDVGFRILAAMRACALGLPGPSHLLVNGHDFECWIVQRACAVLYSGNVHWRGVKIDLGAVAPQHMRDALLEGKWPSGGGLYLGPPPESGGLDGVGMAGMFGAANGTGIRKIPVGFRISLTGIPFAVRWLADEQIDSSVAEMFHSHRPTGVTLLGPAHRLEVRFTWDPNVPAGEILEYGPLTMAELDALWDSVGGRPALM